MHYKLSIRHNAGIEAPSGATAPIGVSTSVRKYWRQHFQAVPGMLGTNDQINYLIATDYAGAAKVHRFRLRSGEPAEIRQSGNFYYVAVIRKNKRHDILVIQPSYKESPSNISNRRLTEEWLDKILSGKERV